MKFFDRYPGKGQMGSEKLNADFFLLIYEIQWKKQPQKEETIIHSLILLLAQKVFLVGSLACSIYIDMCHP